MKVPFVSCSLLRKQKLNFFFGGLMILYILRYLFEEIISHEKPFRNVYIVHFMLQKMAEEERHPSVTFLAAMQISTPKLMVQKSYIWNSQKIPVNSRNKTTNLVSGGRIF